MTYAKKYGLQTGDQIVTPLFATGITKHFVVYLGFEKGIEWIAENHKIYGVRIISASQYFKDVTIISRIDSFRGTSAQRMSIMEKAKHLVNTPYNLASYNCEHFASELTMGKPESRQIDLAVASLVGILFLSLLSE